MSQPLNDSTETPLDRPVLVFVMTDFEQGAILPALRGFGAQLAVSIAEQVASHIPGLERDKLLCSPDEIMGRALAFIANLDPEDFGRKIAGSQLKIQVVPHQVPCPACTKRRIATMNQRPCKACHDTRRVVMIIAPEQRLLTEEQLQKPKLSIVDSSGQEIEA